jgi:hypothetical protein
MRSSPSGRQIPDEIVRYVFPLTTACAGKVVAPIPNTPAVFDPTTFAATGVGLADTAGAGLLFTPFTALPGRLDLASATIISGGGNTGSKISLQWQATTTLLPAPTGAAVPDFIDPTVAAGAHTKQLDFNDVIIPDTGAAISPFLTCPADLVVNTVLNVLLSVAVLWKGSAIRNPLGTP